MNRFKIYDSGFKNNALILILASCFLLLASTLLAHAQEAFVGPGGCTNKAECRSYCDVDSNKEECLTFAVENGLMSEEDAERARKFLNQTGPGGCRGEECRTYCEDISHREECLNFAEEQGFISAVEAARMRKFQVIEAEGGPGGCRGEECRVYCEEESHRDECFAFAREKGLIGEEEIKHYETGLKIREKIKEAGGPGGCTSENECREYCSNIAHVEECVEFGAVHSGQSPDEVRKMLEEFKEHKERFQSDPRFGEFEEEGFGGFEREGRGEFDGPKLEREGEFQGPGGCDSEESCRRFCMENPESCGYMNRPEDTRGEYREGMMPPPGFAPPQGEFQLQMSPPPEFNQYQEEYQHQEEYQPRDFDQNFQPPPSESQPTSYDHSRSFIANVISSFLLPFRK